MRRRSFTVLIGVIALVVGCTDGTPPLIGPSSPPSAGPLLTLLDNPVSLDVTAGGTGTFNFAGQSLLVPGGNYNTIRFNWYTFQRTPAAFGSLYLLNQEYLGLPRDLGPSTPGFIARSERVANNEYLFAPDIALSGGLKYWFYTDTPGSFAGSFDQDIFAGGDMYVTGVPTLPFRKAPAAGRMVGGVYVPPPPGVFVDANFKIQGYAAAVR